MEAIFTSLAEECRTLRRDLHRNPELSGREVETHAAVIDDLRTLGFESRVFPDHHGILAVWEGEDPSRCVALRADMDALPLHEETGLPWSSAHAGVMHACGHDGHMAILLGVARWLRRQGKRTPQSVKLIFQPAEETGRGAPHLIASGALETPRVEAIFGLHGWPELPAGTAAVPSGPVMAAVDNFSLRLRGRGGHGAMPHQARDPIVAAAALITAAQTLISRRLPPLEPAVLTFGSIAAGEAPNVIPETCLLRGTLRTLDPERRRLLRADFEALTRHLAAAHEVTAEIEWIESCPPTVNDTRMAALAQAAAVRALGSERVLPMPPSMGGEDFAYFLERVPGAYFWLGLGMDRGPLHNPHFDFNDEAIAAGIALFAHLLEGYFSAANGESGAFGNE